MTAEDYRFEIAISFAGDNKRDLVRKVAELLQEKVGKGKVFFDEWFESELAGADGQVVLQNYYCKQTRLVVTCVCQRYNEKPWTQEEWRAIQAFERDLRDAGTGNVKRMRFLPLRFGDGEIDGLFSTAIIPDVRNRTPEEIAKLILERLDHAKQESVKSSDLKPHAATLNKPPDPEDICVLKKKANKGKLPPFSKVWVWLLILLFMVLTNYIIFYKPTPDVHNDDIESSELKRKFHNIATIPVGTISYYPDNTIDLNKKAGFLFVSSENANKYFLKVISLSDNSLVRSIELKRKPEAVFSSENGKNLFILLTVDYSTVNRVDQDVENEIIVLDAKKLNTIRTISVKTVQNKRLTNGISVGGQLYLTQLSMDSSLFVVNSLTGEIVKTISIGAYPNDIIVSPDSRIVYISAQDTVHAFSISSLEQVKEYRLYHRVNQIDIDFEKNNLYVSHWGGGISIIDLVSGEIKEKPTIHSWGIRLEGGEKYLYCVDDVSGKLNAFDTNNFELVGSFKLGASPKAIENYKEAEKLYITNVKDGTISIVDSNEFRY